MFNSIRFNSKVYNSSASVLKHVYEYLPSMIIPMTIKPLSTVIDISDDRVILPQRSQTVILTAKKG